MRLNKSNFLKINSLELKQFDVNFLMDGDDIDANVTEFSASLK